MHNVFARIYEPGEVDLIQTEQAPPGYLPCWWVCLAPIGKPEGDGQIFLQLKEAIENARMELDSESGDVLIRACLIHPDDYEALPDP